MAAGKMTASFILKLEDQLSGGLSKLQAALDKIFAIAKKLSFPGLEGATDKIDKVTQAGAKLGRELTVVTQAGQSATTQINAVGRAAESTAFKLGRMTAQAQHWASMKLGAVGAGMQRAGKQIGVIGGAVAGYSLIEPVRAYADYENSLRHMAITQKLEGPAVEAEVTRLAAIFNREALKFGQKSTSIASAANFLLTTGMSMDTVERLLPAHAQASLAYNFDPDAMGRAVFALHDSLKIGEADMPAALAAMAYAAKEGHFNVEAFSHFLPKIAGMMSMMGMTGRGAADQIFAVLETVVKNTGMSEEAATNTFDALRYITSPIGNRSMMHQGIDLKSILLDAEKKGVDPLTATLDTLQRRTRGMTPLQMTEWLNAILHNQQAAEGVMSMLQHRDEMEKLRQKLHGVNSGTINTDADTARRAPLFSVRTAEEELAQINRRLGKGFAPLLHVINAGLDEMAGLFERIDKIAPGASDRILLVAGAGLALTAVLAAIGIAAPVVAAGFGLIGTVLGAIFSPVTAVIAIVALVAAAAYDIYENWAEFLPFFVAMWDGVQKVFGGFIRFLAGVFNFDMAAAYEGLVRIWNGYAAIYSNVFGVIQKLFEDFTAWVDGWTNGAMTSAIGGIKTAWDGLKTYFVELWAGIRAPFDKFVEDFANSPVGRLMGLSSDPASSAPDGPKGQEGLAPPKRDNSGYIELRFANPPPGLEGRRPGGGFQPIVPGMGMAVGIP